MWQWWLALGKTNTASSSVTISLNFMRLAVSNMSLFIFPRQWLVSDDLQRSVDCLLHLPE